ncbi:DMT family transporter, partial [Acinetobacter baumannii]
LLLEALKYISSTKASILSASEPISIVCFGVLLLGETLTLSQLIGIVTILGGSILSLMKTNTSFQSSTT